SLAIADQSEEGPENGSNQIEIQGKDVIEILRVELEGANRIKSPRSMDSRTEVKSRDRSKVLFFAHLTDHVPVSLDSHSALQDKVDCINSVALTEDSFPGLEMNLVGQRGHATKFFYGSVSKEIHRLKEDDLFYGGELSWVHNQN
ncbi:MAG TPA: hypothetical protein VFU31_21480, partial [Candidatus Binatia bacterium]|nr:hypothetical protein [Candidatus Binatia bacterium]